MGKEDKIAALQKENDSLKRQIEDDLCNLQKLKEYKSYIREMTEKIVFLKDRLENNAVMIHVHIQKTRLDSAESMPHWSMKEYPLYVRIPVSTIRIDGMPPSRVNEVSPECMNSLVSQIEADLRDRVIILANKE